MWENLDRPPLVVGALRRALVDGPRGSWARVDVVASTGSTNADLIDAAPSLPDRTALIADFQTGARGRHHRPWSAPAGSQLAMSALIRFPGIDPTALGWCSLLTGVVVVDVLRRVAEVDASLKWPNDVLVDGRKVAGILAEVASGHGNSTVASGHGNSTVAAGQGNSTVVIGVGLNVSMTAAELPVPSATSLALEGASVTDRDTLARALLRGLGDAVDSWRDDDWSTAPLAAIYRSRCDTIGRAVRVEMRGRDDLLGTAVDVDEFGRVVIAPSDGGEPEAVSAGDVTHLRRVAE